jgi:type VI secretion system protein VasG
VESGGRMVDAILTNTMLPRISREILTRLMEGKALGRIHITAEDDDMGYLFD